MHSGALLELPYGHATMRRKMHRHCSKVFKKRDPAINPMNMGSRGPPEDNLHTRHVSQAHTSNAHPNNAASAHLSPLFRRDR